MNEKLLLLRNEDKIIFLDIDGVLNPTMYMMALGKMWKLSCNQIKSRDYYGHLFFYQNCDALKKIIDETGAKIVMSSTWRLAGLSEMKALWKYRELSGDVIDVTPNEIEVVKSGGAKFYDEVCRGQEIQLWLDKNEFKGNYVIIDDTQDMLKSQDDFFVRTHSSVGLTMSDAEMAIRILNK